MGWMNDTLKYFSHDPVHRKYEHNKLTFSLLYAFTENFLLPFSHDEVVHWQKIRSSTKCPGTCGSNSPISASCTPISTLTRARSSLFMGQEFAQRPEWSEAHSLDCISSSTIPTAGIQRLVNDLNHLYAAEPALHQV